MVLLTDDCLLVIFSYLKLADQLEVTKADPHFKDIMPILWRKPCKNLDLSPFRSDLDMDEYKTMIDCVFKNVQQIKDKTMTSDKFNILMMYVFPNVQNFVFTQRPEIGQSDLQDDDIRKITIAFPNLRVFSPHGTFTGKYFSDITHLENLTLRNCYCESFCTSYLGEIIEKAPLKSLNLNLFRVNDVFHYTIPQQHLTKLEYLNANDEEIKWFFTGRPGMENLKELIVDVLNVTRLGKVAISINQSGRSTLSLVQVCNVRECLEYTHLFRTKKLMISSNFEIPIAVEALRFFGMPHLRELHFKNCEMGDMCDCASIIYNTYNKQLELLCIEECIFTFTHYIISVDRVIADRTKKITLKFINNLGCVNNENYPLNWSLRGESELLELSTQGVADYVFTSDRLLVIF